MLNFNSLPFNIYQEMASHPSFASSSKQLRKSAREINAHEKVSEANKKFMADLMQQKQKPRSTIKKRKKSMEPDAK